MRKNQKIRRFFKETPFLGFFVFCESEDTMVYLCDFSAFLSSVGEKIGELAGYFLSEITEIEIKQELERVLGFESVIYSINYSQSKTFNVDFPFFLCFGKKVCGIVLPFERVFGVLADSEVIVPLKWNEVAGLTIFAQALFLYCGYYPFKPYTCTMGGFFSSNDINFCNIISAIFLGTEIFGFDEKTKELLNNVEFSINLPDPETESPGIVSFINKETFKVEDIEDVSFLDKFVWFNKIYDFLTERFARLAGNPEIFGGSTN